MVQDNQTPKPFEASGDLPGGMIIPAGGQLGWQGTGPVAGSNSPDGVNGPSLN